MVATAVALIDKDHTLIRVCPKGTCEALDFLKRQPWVPGFARIEHDLKHRRITVTIRSRSYIFHLLPVTTF